MPVTPGGMGASFDVLLAFQLDPEANRRVQQGVSTLEQELKRIQDTAAGVGPEFKKSGEEVKKTSKDVSQALRAEARAMRAEAASIASDLRSAQIGLLRDLSSSIASISQKAIITGGAIVGGIFAEVQRYVNLAPDATAETRAWAAETERLGKARARIDAVLLREALPLLQQAGRLANQAAGIVERHPEIVSLALKAGTILVGVGAIGLAVSKGIKLVADVQYLATIPAQLTAARLQDLAADKQLAAAQIQLKNVGGKVPGGGAGLSGAGAALGVGGFVLANVGLTAALEKQFDQLDQVLITRFGGIGKTVTNILETALLPFLPALRPLRDISRTFPQITELGKKILGIGEASQKAGADLSEAAGRIRGSANEAAIVEAFSSWKQDDANLIREAAQNRKEILAEAEREIANITRNYANERVDINRRFNSNRANITRDFEQEDLRAAEDHQRAREQEIAQGNERLREIEESHQERLREIRERAAESIEAATFARDALGLVRAQRQLAEDEREENQSARAEAARARRETAQRIQELDSQYAIERERRLQQYQQDLADNEAQRAEELRRAAEAFQQERAQAQASQAQKLRDLQEGLNAERIRRREVFLAQIRDLDEYLIGDRSIRNKYYQQSLVEAEAYFARLRQAFASATGGAFSGVTGSVGTIPTRDGGGYASRGIYGLARNGIPEFVLSGSTTKAAERAIGANLTDESLSRLFGRLGEMRSAVYNDNRRMTAPLSKDARRIYEETARVALQKALGVT